MPQPEPISTTIATAFVQCMIRTGYGCKRRLDLIAFIFMIAGALRVFLIQYVVVN